MSSLPHISTHIVAFQSISSRFKLFLRFSSYMVVFTLFNSCRRFSTNFVSNKNNKKKKREKIKENNNVVFQFIPSHSHVSPYVIAVNLYLRFSKCVLDFQATMSSLFKLHRRLWKSIVAFQDPSSLFNYIIVSQIILSLFNKHRHVSSYNVIFHVIEPLVEHHCHLIVSLLL